MGKTILCIICRKPSQRKYSAILNQNEVGTDNLR